MPKEPKIKRVKLKGGASPIWCLTSWPDGKQKQEWFSTEQEARDRLEQIKL